MVHAKVPTSVFFPSSCRLRCSKPFISGNRPSPRTEYRRRWRADQRWRNGIAVRCGGAGLTRGPLCSQGSTLTGEPARRRRCASRAGRSTHAQRAGMISREPPSFAVQTTAQMLTARQWDERADLLGTGGDRSWQAGTIPLFVKMLLNGRSLTSFLHNGRVTHTQAPAKRGFSAPDAAENAQTASNAPQRAF